MKSQRGNGGFVSQLLKYQGVGGNKRAAMSVLWACEAKSKIRRRNPARRRRLSVQTRTHRQSLNMSIRHRETCERRRHQIQTATRNPDRPACSMARCLMVAGFLWPLHFRNMFEHHARLWRYVCIAWKVLGRVCRPFVDRRHRHGAFFNKTKVDHIS